ncbi:MAG: NYN domain-containing protein [Thermodesulfobacteriota bacterium]
MTTIPTRTHTVIRVFVDYWNFQLTLNESEAKVRGVKEYRFPVDWFGLGRWLADKGRIMIGASQIDYGGCHIYASYNADEKFYRWMMNVLNRQPGIIAQCIKRTTKSFPRCQSCFELITHCPRDGCQAPISATTEKGVDTRIVTDMISLAWQDAYDVAVLASLDADLIPAVNFVQQKGKRVIQAGFPPKGTSLATECWASFDVFPDRLQIQRLKPKS